METIIQKLQRYAKEGPNSPILFDEVHTKGITYAQLDDLSGRVYAWLKSEGIGKEDFILINLPRGVLPIIAMVGVWRAGSAWVLVEDTYAPERIDYIRRDCGCKLELSSANWDEVMRMEPLAGYPNIDHQSRDNETGELFAPLDIGQPQMRAIEKAYKISRNEFFITVAGLAISFYNNTPDIKISWIYNGREDEQMMNTVGLLFRDLPVSFRLRDEDTLRAVFTSVHEQVRLGIEHSCYPYVDLHNHVSETESAYLLYQRDIRDIGGLEDFNVETVETRQNQAASQTILDMEILDGAEGLQLMIDFAASRYREESIESFKELFVRLAQSLVTHNSQSDITVGELRRKISDKRNFFQSVLGVFSRKK